MNDKKAVSPFEFAIAQIVDPEAAKSMREETREEQAARIEKNICDFVGRIKIKK